MNPRLFFAITPNQQVQDETERPEGSGKDYKKLSVLLQLKAKKFSLRPIKIRSPQNTHRKSVNQLIVNSDTRICFCFYTDSKKISEEFTQIKEYQTVRAEKTHTQCIGHYLCAQEMTFEFLAKIQIFPPVLKSQSVLCFSAP